MTDHTYTSRRRRLSLIWLAAFALILLASTVHVQTKSDCLACHSDKSLAKTKNGKKLPLYVSESALNGTPHGQLACTDCHAGFDPNKMPHRANIQLVDCTGCHSDAQSKHVFHKQLVAKSGPGLQRSAECKSCHGTHMSANKVGACATCHSEVATKFARSAHGKALAANVDSAPNCLACHKNNIVDGRKVSDPAKLKIAQEKVCMSCHAANPAVTGRMGTRPGFVASYEKSVHGMALLKGNAAAANCVDCHSSHEVSKGSDPASSVNRAHIPDTCGKCHSDIEAEYAKSIHGTAFKMGRTEAPVCTDCHGEHNILGPRNPLSPVAPRNVAEQVCGSCHSSVKLSEKYGINSDRYKTFSDSYHGLAIRGGAVNVANCASCHGVHNILPASDPDSTVNPRNVPKTCGKCHPGANKRFAMGKVHVESTVQQQPVLWIIGLIYILLIVGTIGGMLAHNFLDLFKKWRKHVAEHDLHGLYVRMTVSERIQHAMMTASFIMLAITGFMLHYPDSWWVAGIRSVVPHVFALRSLLHRVSAVVMVGSCVYHVFYVLLTVRGRELVTDLLPRRQDMFDAIGMVKYGLGLQAAKPKLGRFSYIEKSEYWALVWGSVVMTVTGVFMWADNFFIGLLTKLGWDISRTIHFYEAWLAVLAIVVWHFYFVIFNPDIYPMNASWITGTLPEDVVAEEHPLEYEALKDRIADAKGEPPKPPEE